AGVENVNAQVDDLISTGVLRRVLAYTELKFSNSMIEAGGVRSNINSCSSTPWTASRQFGDWSTSTCRNTTGYCHIRRFADKRLTRCTTAQGMRFQRHWRRAPPRPKGSGIAIPPRAKHCLLHRVFGIRQGTEHTVAMDQQLASMTLCGVGEFGHNVASDRATPDGLASIPTCDTG